MQKGLKNVKKNYKGRLRVGICLGKISTEVGKCEKLIYTCLKNFRSQRFLFKVLQNVM